MTKQEKIVEKYKNLLANASDLIKVEGAQHSRYEPHPFVVGVQHVVYASDHTMGILGEEALRKYPCARADCSLGYDEHKAYDFALFVSALRDCTSDELSDAFGPLVGELKNDGIEGIALDLGDYTVEQ